MPGLVSVPSPHSDLMVGIFLVISFFTGLTAPFYSLSSEKLTLKHPERVTGWGTFHQERVWGAWVGVHGNNLAIQISVHRL